MIQPGQFDKYLGANVGMAKPGQPYEIVFWCQQSAMMSEGRRSLNSQGLAASKI
jgi:hypothetical protein